jgi:hypothetical protein
MTIAQSVAEILQQHVILEVEGMNRRYLNVYVPRLQIVEGMRGASADTAVILWLPCAGWNPSPASL